MGKVQKNIYRKYWGKVYKKQILTIYRNTLWGEPKKKKCLFPIYKKKKAFIGKYTNSGQNKEKERVLFYLQETHYRKGDIPYIQAKHSIWVRYKRKKVSIYIGKNTLYIYINTISPRQDI